MAVSKRSKLVTWLNFGLIVYIVGLILIITWCLIRIANRDEQPKNEAVEAAGLVRVVGIDDEEFVAKPDVSCIVPVSYIADDKTGNLVILAEMDGKMLKIRSQDDLMYFCKQ